MHDELINFFIRYFREMSNVSPKLGCLQITIVGGCKTKQCI